MIVECYLSPVTYYHLVLCCCWLEWQMDCKKSSWVTQLFTVE